MEEVSPISVLWGNIIHTFENIDPNGLVNHKNAVEQGLVNPEIDYDMCREGKIKTPFAHLLKRNIYVQEAYLEHLWAFIYSMQVIYDVGVQLPMKNGTFNGEVLFNNPLLNRAYKLFEWSISLVDKITPWDIKLPNPKIHHNDCEKFFAEKVNALFQNSVAYILYHEYAHLTLGHDCYYLGRNKFDMESLSEEEISTFKQLEQEADLFAFDRVTDRANHGVKRLIDGLPIFMAICSSLFLLKKPTKIQQNKHPDLDLRLMNFLSELDLYEEDDRFYMYYFGCFAIIMFLRKHNIPPTPKNDNTAKDYFYNLLQDLDEIKFHDEIKYS